MIQEITIKIWIGKDIKTIVKLMLIYAILHKMRLNFAIEVDATGFLIKDTLNRTILELK